MSVKVERQIRTAPEEEFSEVIKRVPDTQQNAIRAVRYLGIDFCDIVKVCARDVSQSGVRVKRDVREWVKGDESNDMKVQLVALASRVSPDERLFEPHKPLARAIYDLEVVFGEGKKQWQQYLALEAREVVARLPNFVLLGAPKCATTWLYNCLAAHPEVYVPAEKELEFFGSWRYYLGMNWYKQQFVNWTTEKVGGDTSVGYFDSELALARMCRHLDSSSLKLLLLLREPISRALSYYEFRMLTGNAPRSFEESLNMWYFRDLYIESGHYYKCYQHYLDYFPKEHILVILFEEIQRDPLATLRKVFRFLGVQPDYYNEVFSIRENVGHSIRNVALHYWLYHIGMLARAKLPCYYGNLIYGKLKRFNERFNLTTERRSRQVSREVLRRLEEEFRPSNLRLEELSGVSLSLW